MAHHFTDPNFGSPPPSPTLVLPTFTVPEAPLSPQSQLNMSQQAEVYIPRSVMAERHIQNGMEDGEEEEYVQRERPADQREWTDADLLSLQRDRYAMEQVNGLLVSSDPHEFARIFNNPDDAPEDRITPADYMERSDEAWHDPREEEAQGAHLAALANEDSADEQARGAGQIWRNFVQGLDSSDVDDQEILERIAAEEREAIVLEAAANRVEPDGYESDEEGEMLNLHNYERDTEDLAGLFYDVIVRQASQLTGSDRFNFQDDMDDILMPDLLNRNQPEWQCG